MRVNKQSIWAAAGRAFACAAIVSVVAGCGGGGDEVRAKPQVIQLGTNVSALGVNGSTQLSASASSGLSVTYSSATPTVCSVSASGAVLALAVGSCLIQIDQAGDADYAPATTLSASIAVNAAPYQSITLGAAPRLEVFGQGRILASATSGLAPRYASLTPAVCTVDASSGVVTGVSAGACTVKVEQEGDAQYAAATVTQSLVIAPASTTGLPDAPSEVSATLGASGSEVVLTIVGPAAAGGSAITAYHVVSSPSGLSASGASPVHISCPSGCAGYAFAVSAVNASGAGATASAVHVLTNFSVVTVFYEPDTQPNDSIFVGSFTLDSTTQTILNLQGRLSESMTGGTVGYPNDSMNWLTLAHPLMAWHDASLGGSFAAVFKNADTHTFWTGTGGDGWSPAAGVQAGGLYYGYPTKSTGIANPGNAYALIFVPDDPTQALTQAQIDKLAYADCAPGGMMGATCMTGTSVAGYGSVGTMSGYPLSQTITLLAN